MESESEPLLREPQPHQLRRYDGVRKESGSDSSSVTGSLESSEDSASSNGSSDERPPWTFYAEVGNFVVSTFLGGVANSIFSPFYTKEATEKGLAVWQSGVVSWTRIIVNQIF